MRQEQVHRCIMSALIQTFGQIYNQNDNTCMETSDSWFVGLFAGNQWTYDQLIQKIGKLYYWAIFTVGLFVCL